MPRAFLSHRIDFQSVPDVIQVWRQYEKVFSETSVTVFSMANYLEAERAQNASDRTIVESCLRELEASDLLIFDCSDLAWTYIGCIFEVVHASILRLPVYTYVGESSHGARPWLRYHSRVVTSSMAELKLAILDDQVREGTRQL